MGYVLRTYRHGYAARQAWLRRPLHDLGREGAFGHGWERGSVVGKPLGAAQRIAALAVVRG
ncbi:hypothetical protein GCM10027271_51310 [Saccharopolyspora gloriosae]